MASPRCDPAVRLCEQSSIDDVADDRKGDQQRKRCPAVDESDRNHDQADDRGDRVISTGNPSRNTMTTSYFARAMRALLNDAENR